MYDQLEKMKLSTNQDSNDKLQTPALLNAASIYFSNDQQNDTKRFDFNILLHTIAFPLPLSHTTSNGFALLYVVILAWPEHFILPKCTSNFLPGLLNILLVHYGLASRLHRPDT